MLTYNYFKPLALLLLAGACTPAPSGTTTDTDADSTGDAASTTDEPATGSTSPIEATTGDPTTTEEPEATTTANDPTEADTGVLDPEQLGACEAYCERATECGLESDAADCLAACSEDFAELVEELMGECAAENQALLTCAAALSCQELDQEIDAGPCSAEWTAYANCYGIEPESGVMRRE